MNCAKSLTLLLPFPAYVITYVYNRTDPDKVTGLIFKGLTALIFANLIGYYVFGLTNYTHNLEDRINLPFVHGLYEAAHILAVLNLMMLYKFRLIKLGKSEIFTPNNILTFFYFALNLVIIFYINSRLITLVFTFILLLYSLKLITKKVLFWGSWTLLPLLLNLGTLIYSIVSLPIFAALMQRVDIDDVTTFNNRKFIWEAGIDWLTDDRRGLLFGNGEHGQYFIGTLHDIGRLFLPKTPEYIHFHSTVFEMLMNHGLVGFSIFAVLLYRLYIYYRQQYTLARTEGVFLIIIVYMLFTLQIDIFFYVGRFGFLLFSVWIARLASLEPLALSSAEITQKELISVEGRG